MYIYIRNSSLIMCLCLHTNNVRMYEHVVTKGTQLPMILQHVDQIQEVKQYISKSLDIQSWQQCGQVAFHSTVII